MKGRVRKDPQTGTWWFEFSYSDDRGKRRHVRRRGHRTEADASKALRKMLSALDVGDKKALKLPTDRPLGPYLIDWLDSREDLKPSTLAGYRQVVAVYIAPEAEGRPSLGHVKLRNLTDSAIGKHYKALRETGGARGHGVSARTVQYVHAVLRSGLAHAVERG